MKNAKGFTLIELMIAMTISLIVLAGYYASFKSQHNSFDDQEQINILQQNLRSAMTIMSGDIRMAGYDPLQSGIPTFMIASSNQIKFTMDINGNGVVTDPNEDITFRFLNNSDTTNPPNGNGIADVGYFGETAIDSGAAEFGRDTGGGVESVAEGITAVAFAYSFDNDADGRIDTNGAGHIIWAVDSDNDGILDTDLDTDGDGVITAADDTNSDGFINDSAPSLTVPVGAVRAVRIWLLGATRRESADRKFANHPTVNFVVGDKIIVPANNPYLRQRRLRMVTTTIQCRNMGL